MRNPWNLHEAILICTFSTGPQISKTKEFLPLRKGCWPYGDCFQLRNWLQSVKSKQWNRSEFPKPFKILLLQTLSKVGGSGGWGLEPPGLPWQADKLLGWSLLSTLWPCRWWFLSALVLDCFLLYFTQMKAIPDRLDRNQYLFQVSTMFWNCSTQYEVPPFFFNLFWPPRI